MWTAVVGCERATVEVGPGVPIDLAMHRAATLSDVRYRVSLSIPDDLAEPIRGHQIVSFTLSDATEPVILDFAQSTDRVLNVMRDGEAVPYEVRNEHIVIARGGIRAGENALEIEFLAGDGSLNRTEDFLYTLFVPDRARVALPIFDQPNLKAVFELRLDVPADWRAVANGRIEQHEIAGDRASFEFAETLPISPYLFSFAAGRFEVEVGRRGGREMRMYHRETDTAKLARNRDAIFDLHAVALEWMEEYTAVPYPFGKFDFVLVPSFQYGGMEHPGAILYRASSLLLDESATQNQRLGRASLIAHETAHMWFGDLVTMDWFDDVWMKEVFANFMAAKIVNPSFPEVDHDLRFLLAHYPAAYDVDRSPGANPIRQGLENLNEAGTLYGAIIYQKAPIVMKHLELLMGEEPFRDGLRQYLSDHRFGNASWPDLVTVLDALTDEDLAEWSRAWVEEPRRPTVSVAWNVEAGKISTMSLSQHDPGGRDLVWNQRIEVLLGYENRVGHMIPAHLRSRSEPVAEATGLPAPDFVLPNGRGLAYGQIDLDDQSREHLLRHLPRLEDPLTRAIGWLGIWEAMLNGQVDPPRLIDVMLAALEREGDELNVQRLLGYVTVAYWRFLTVDQRDAVASRVEDGLWQLVERTSRRSARAAYFNAFRTVALTPHAVDRLRDVWSGEERVRDLPLAERDMIALAQALALRGVPDAGRVLEEQLRRIENPDRRAEFTFVLPALSADAEERDRFFESLYDPANRAREPWVLAGLRFLHHPLRATDAERYIRPSLDLLEEIQRTGDIFFPARWLDATLGGHNSRRAAITVQRFLDETPDLAPRLRGKVLQSADMLFRSAEVVGEG